MEIWRLPEVLIIQLKRFQYREGDFYKIDEFVDFPVYTFDALKYVKGVEQSPDLAKTLTAGSKKLQNTYDLFAVVNHMGSYSSGHYTTFCLNEQSRKWILYDDDEVFEV